MTSTAPPTSVPATTTPSGGSGASSRSASAGSARKRRESTWDKALRLLTEGKVQVVFVSEGRYLIRATVEGDSGSYVVDYGMTREHRWTCSCPAYGDCSHLRAVQRVTAKR